MQWHWEFGDDLDRYMHKAGFQAYAQLSRASGISTPAITRLRYGFRLSGKKVAHKLSDKLSPIIRVFIHKGAIISTTAVEEWLNKLPYGCLNEKGYKQIIQEAEKELTAIHAATDHTIETDDLAVTPSREERRQADVYDDAQEENTVEELVARKKALLRDLAHIEKQLMERKDTKPQ